MALSNLFRMERSDGGFLLAAPAISRRKYPRPAVPPAAPATSRRKRPRPVVPPAAPAIK